MGFLIVGELLCEGPGNLTVTTLPCRQSWQQVYLCNPPVDVAGQAVSWAAVTRPLLTCLSILREAAMRQQLISLPGSGEALDFMPVAEHPSTHATYCPVPLSSPEAILTLWMSSVKVNNHLDLCGIIIFLLVKSVAEWQDKLCARCLETTWHWSMNMVYLIYLGHLDFLSLKFCNIQYTSFACILLIYP